MINWLKLHFIPHAGNAHRPHFLLTHNIRQLLGIVIGVELLLFILPTLNFVNIIDTLNMGAVLPGVLSSLTNEKRQANNLPYLLESPTLSQAAQLKAEDMASKSYFAHTSPEGITPWHWFDRVGYEYSYAGENLAVNFTDSEEVTEAWMRSPTHRANIVGGAYREIGTGVATGMYKGREAIFVAQLYASPAPVRINANAPVSDLEESGTAIAGIPEQEEVLGEANVEAAASQSPNFIERALSSPRETTSAVLFVIFAIVLIAIILSVIIKFEHKHPDLITNGVAVAAIIFAVHLTNSYIAEENFETSFMAFDQPAVSITDE